MATGSHPLAPFFRKNRKTGGTFRIGDSGLRSANVLYWDEQLTSQLVDGTKSDIKSLRPVTPESLQEYLAPRGWSFTGHSSDDIWSWDFPQAGLRLYYFAHGAGGDDVALFRKGESEYRDKHVWSVGAK